MEEQNKRNLQGGWPTTVLCLPKWARKKTQFLLENVEHCDKTNSFSHPVSCLLASPAFSWGGCSDLKEEKCRRFLLPPPALELPFCPGVPLPPLLIPPPTPRTTEDGGGGLSGNFFSGGGSSPNFPLFSGFGPLAQWRAEEGEDFTEKKCFHPPPNVTLLSWPREVEGEEKRAHLSNHDGGSNCAVSAWREENLPKMAEKQKPSLGGKTLKGLFLTSQGRDGRSWTSRH